MMASETRTQTFFRYLDNVVSPETRQKALTFVVNFTKERPYVATYIYLFLLFSLLPILGLVVFVLFLVSVLLFWVAVALCVTSLILLFTGTAALMVWVWAVCLVLSGRWLLNLISPGVVAKAESIGLVDNSGDVSEPVKKQVEAGTGPGNKKESGSKDAKGGGALKDRTNERTIGDDYFDFDDGEKPRKSPEMGEGGFVAVKTPGGSGGGSENSEPESESAKMKRDIEKSLK